MAMMMTVAKRSELGYAWRAFDEAWITKGQS